MAVKSLAILPIEGDATAGQDGLFYVLESKDVLVLRSDGRGCARVEIPETRSNDFRFTN